MTAPPSAIGKRIHGHTKAGPERRSRKSDTASSLYNRRIT